MVSVASPYRLTPFVRRLLIGIGALYVLELLVVNFGGLRLDALLELQPSVSVQSLWQVFTFIFTLPLGAQNVLSSVIFLLFAAWMLSDFERLYGTRRTMELVAASALSSALPTLLVSLVFRGYQSITGSQVLLSTVIVCIAWARRRAGNLLLFGRLPVHPYHLIAFVVGLDFLVFLNTRDVVTLVANLGAAGGGVAFAEWMARPPSRRPGKRRPKKRKGGPKLQALRGGRDSGPRWLN